MVTNTLSLQIMSGRSLISGVLAHLGLPLYKRVQGQSPALSLTRLLSGSISPCYIFVVGLSMICTPTLHDTLTHTLARTTDTDYHSYG